MGQMRACSKSVLGGILRPVTPDIIHFDYTLEKRHVHLEMRNLKKIELHRLKNGGEKG